MKTSSSSILLRASDLQILNVLWCIDEEAKKAAQEGSSSDNSIPPSFRGTLPWSRSARLQHYNARLKATVATEWKKSPRYHRIKPYDPSLPSNKFVKLTERMPRKLAVILVQLRTGHTILNKHLHRINRADSPICPCCKRADETIIHYLLHCPAHADARSELHRQGGRDARVLTKLLTKPELLPLLFRFIARTRRYHSVFGEIPALPPLEKPTRAERIAELNAIQLPHALLPVQVPRNAGPDWVPPARH
ncbi:RNA-directed DNA polymerase from transposon X-element [Mycena sanguinolenta]|uniref:RNA-directed DNA polymerase from transposon X-element n=1 Tax=Mycena sanguinolenta TaxID=230812 RepID=A0A8H7D2P3_9AGAR|nr:RNA-directed DNA polymerase from transposon X-element [Mycena sanguinolenta]